MSEREYRGIRNRDVLLLTRIFYIMADIRSLQRRCEFHTEQLFSTTKRLTGMPGGGGLPHGFDSIIGELEEMNRDYIERINEYCRDLMRAEKTLNNIPHETMRTFVRMVYVDQLAQAEVLRELEMSEYQFDKARRAIEEAESMRKVDWPEKWRAEAGG